MGTSKINISAIYNLEDRYVSVDSGTDIDNGVEIEYKVSDSGLYLVLDIRYTRNGEYSNYGKL
jgi:hypothetical protein